MRNSENLSDVINIRVPRNIPEAEDLCWRILLIGDDRKGLNKMWDDLVKLMGSYEEANHYFIAFMWRRGTGG